MTPTPQQIQEKIQLIGIAAALTQISLQGQASPAESTIITELERWYQNLAQVDITDETVFTSPTVPTTPAVSGNLQTQPSPSAATPNQAINLQSLAQEVAKLLSVIPSTGTQTAAGVISTVASAIPTSAAAAAGS